MDFGLSFVKAAEMPLYTQLYDVSKEKVKEMRVLIENRGRRKALESGICKEEREV